ncbi:hypothetical protein RIF29_08119 [Crotalaria pallida]|uniref:DUF679 domain membrane protein 2 n=1 Tax=Crotalaria pallida TaxID=3830 RepID=A0AAN9PBR7_CROPI
MNEVLVGVVFAVVVGDGVVYGGEGLVVFFRNGGGSRGVKTSTSLKFHRNYKKTIAMVADSTSSSTTTATASTESNALTSAVGSLIKLLPTGTVFLFQFLNPIATNNGQCATSNRYVTATLLVACAFSCCFASFTDSYTGDDKKRHYGIVTATGLYDPSSSSSSNDTIHLSKYRLKFSDFVHAVLSMVVFAVLALLDTNTVHCFYPGFDSTQKQLLQVLPPAIGVFAGGVFMLFPNTRHGFGYPTSSDPHDHNTASSKSNDSAAPPQTAV